jgi:hypothetical protein
VFSLKAARDNHIHRRDAGISISMLTGCARAIALEDVFDVYEPVISSYNKNRGTWLHAMVEADPDPPSWIIRERRLYYDVEGIMTTGQPDEVDTKYKVLVDYKSKDNLPKKRDPAHEFQFNGYAFLLARGNWFDTKERANIHVETIAAHYLTWKTKVDKAFMKMTYPLWPIEETEALIKQRIEPIQNWNQYAILPSCDAYVSSPYWKCSCEKWSDQLLERGIVGDLDELKSKAEAKKRQNLIFTQ